MATQIKTRILNKYDLLANYSTFKPLKGEICIAEVTSTTPSFDGTKPAPIVGIKVGDGTHTFAELPWIQAVAGDVTAEIKALTGVADIDTKIAALEGRKLATVAELNALSEELGAVKATVNHAEHGNAALKSAIDTLSSNTSNSLATKVDKAVAEEATSADKLVKKSTVTADINAAKGELNTAIQGVQTNVNNLANGAVKTNTEAIAGINAKIGEVAYTGASMTAAIKALQDSVGNSSEGLGSQVETLKGRVDGHDTAIGTLQTDVGNLQTAISDAGALGSRVVTLEGEMDVVQAATAGYDASKTIQSAIKGVSDAAAAAQSKADANEGKITTLVGSDANKSVRDIAAEETAKIVAGADENYNTLKEIADWIKSDTTGAAEMANDIAEMQGLLGVVEGEDLPKSVDTRISEAIAAENLAQYATDEELGAAIDRISTLETAIGDNGSVKESIDDAKEELVGTSNDASSANTIGGAKKYAEEKAAAAQTAAEATAAADATAKANAAQAAAEGKVTELANGAVKTNTEAITGINAAIEAMDYADPDATTVGGVVTKVTQDNGKIAVTHKKITMDEFDPDATFIFYCGTASDVI